MKAQLNSSNGLRSFAGWLREIGISDVTAWRWRKRHWLNVMNISGRCYIDQAEIDRFTERVKAGEFAKESVVPKNGGTQEANIAAITNRSAAIESKP